MKVGTIVKVTVVVICFGVAGRMVYNFFRGPVPQGPKAFTHWVCTIETCKHEFTLPWTDYQQQKKTGLKCPKCSGIDPERGIQCPSCARVLRLEGHGSPPKKCPHCKAAVPARPKDPLPDEGK